MTPRTFTATSDDGTVTIDGTEEITTELIESRPTLFDYIDLIIKAIAAAALIAIAGRLP
jgi:hypothetical protein